MTQDFGQIVFNLVEATLMSKTEQDTVEDFTDVYDFAAEFEWKRRKAEFRRSSD